MSRLVLYNKTLWKLLAALTTSLSFIYSLTSLKESVVDKKKPSIYSFVEAGKEYFPKLCKALMALVYFTPVAHRDQKHLANIVEGIGIIL